MVRPGIPIVYSFAPSLKSYRPSLSRLYVVKKTPPDHNVTLGTNAEMLYAILQAHYLSISCLSSSALESQAELPS